MKNQAMDLVMSLVRAPSILHPHLLPERPEYFQDTVRMRGAFQTARAIHATLPFLASIERSLWYGDVAPAIRLMFDQCLARERMILALLDQELDDALEALIEARIPVMALKGVDVSRRLYPARSFRPMSDIDLLVPKDSFTLALRALGSRGFRVTGPFPEGRFRVELSRIEGGPTVELHTRLLEGDTHEDVAGQWDRSKTAQIPGLDSRVRVLSHEDQFCYLLRHAAVQHILESPVWLNDLYLLLDQAPAGFDWNRVTAHFAEKRALSAAYFVLSFLYEEWGARVPPATIEALGAKVGRIRRTILLRMVDEITWFDPAKRDRAWLMRARFMMRDSAVDAMRYGLGRRTKAASPEPTSKDRIPGQRGRR